MKISTRLRLAVYVPVILALVITAALVFSYQEMGNTLQTRETVRQVRSIITELNHIVFAYTLYPEERPKQQFLAEQQKLTGLIASAQFTNPDKQRLLDSIRQNNETMEDLFLQLVSAYERGDTAGAEDRLAGLLLLRSYEADTSAALLSGLLDDDIRNTQIITTGAIFLVIVLATVPLTFVLRRTRRSITSSISNLSQGAAVIGSGNLDFRIEEKGSDEITELSRAFNRMTADLKTVTASKADLEIEVAARKEAEDELKAANDNLQEQTIKLEEEVEVRRKAEEDIQRLLEDLRIHEVELETQAEELRAAEEETREARDRYLDLYDFAPAGYLTLEKDGRILEANLTAAGLLGLERDNLARSQFSRFVAPDSQDAFYFHMNQALETGTRQKCEIRMHRRDGAIFYAQLESIAVLSEGEIDNIRTSLSDITERKKAQEELHRYREHLEELVADRTRELRELSHRLVDAQEKERTTIGNELHDEIGQYMTYATLLIDKAARKPDQQILTEARATVQDAIEKIRNLSSVLSPRLLKSAGLLQALVSLIEEYTHRTDIRVEIEHTDGLEEVPEDVALAGYRIVQEALTNVARHARASEVKVRLSHRDGKLRLEVADNGAGFNPGEKNHTTGLTGMRERALALGGELTIASNHGQGTRVMADLPLAETEKA